MAIYSINEINNSIGNKIETNRAINKFMNSLDDSEYFNWKIMIPRDYSRMETDKQISEDKVKDIPHYEIFITKQIGSNRNRRDTLLYCKFPNSDQLFTIRLHMDGGVSYERNEHKFMLRVTDELDRRIILGFCKMYQFNLRDFCYSDNKNPDPWILYKAYNYRSKNMAKRIRSGSYGNSFPYRDLEPYEESCNIFKDVAII